MGTIKNEETISITDIIKNPKDNYDLTGIESYDSIQRLKDNIVKGIRKIKEANQQKERMMGTIKNEETISITDIIKYPKNNSDIKSYDSIQRLKDNISKGIRKAKEANQQKEPTLGTIKNEETISITDIIKYPKNNSDIKSYDSIQRLKDNISKGIRKAKEANQQKIKIKKNEK